MQQTPVNKETKAGHVPKKGLIPDLWRGTVKVFRVVGPLAVSVLLVVWLFHKVHFDQIREILSHDVHFLFIALMMLITMLSHIIRGVRWGIQLRAAGVPRMTWLGYSVAIFSAYALNLIVPYMGEAWRCVYVSRRQNVKLATVVGTDFGDRGSDAVVVCALLGLAMIVAHPTLEKFFDMYPLGRLLERLADHWVWWVSLALGVALFFICASVFRRTRFFAGVDLSIFRMWQGFKVLFEMKGRWLYLWLTLGIWTCYFMETYCCFWAFDFTRELAREPGMALGFLPGLIVFVFGSFSMAVPSNGGLGPWNIAVMYALMLYGIAQPDAAAYSIVAWGFQTIMLIALGIFAACYMSVSRRKCNKLRSAAQ